MSPSALELREQCRGSRRSQLKVDQDSNNFAKRIGLGPLSSGEPSKGFKQRSDVIRFAF